MVKTGGGYELGTTQESLTDGVRRYYDRQQDDRNLLLAGETGLIHHHFGIGDFDRSKPLDDFGQEEIADVLASLESRQVDALIKAMGDIRPEHRVLDAGCGRGGSTFTIAGRFGATVDGVTISPYQHGFATELAAKKGISGQARFHLMNYLELGFPDASFDHVFTNESTEYVIDVSPLLKSFARVLKPGGCYTAATWCVNEEFEGQNEFIDPIDVHYGTNMNTRAQYLAAFEENGFGDIVVDDVTEDAIPYWELRTCWQHRSGVELPFLEGHRSRKILYLFVRGTKR